MKEHGWKDEHQFHQYARAPDNAHFLTDIDFNIPVATINNFRTHGLNLSTYSSRLTVDARTGHAPLWMSATERYI